MPSALGTKRDGRSVCVCVRGGVMLDIVDVHIDKIESICTFRYTNFQMQTNAFKQTHTHTQTKTL